MAKIHQDYKYASVQKISTKNWRVDWDDHSLEEEKILHQEPERSYLRGKFTGVVEALADGKEDIVCLCANVGTVKGLSEDNAIRLASIIENTIAPLVEHRLKKLKNEAAHNKLINRFSS